MANLNVRMSEEEYKKITEDAAKLGLGISDYIRFITRNVKIEVNLERSPEK